MNYSQVCNVIEQCELSEIKEFAHKITFNENVNKCRCETFYQKLTYFIGQQAFISIMSCAISECKYKYLLLHSEHIMPNKIYFKNATVQNNACEDFINAMNDKIKDLKINTFSKIPIHIANNDLFNENQFVRFDYKIKKGLTRLMHGESYSIFKILDVNENLHDDQEFSFDTSDLLKSECDLVKMRMIIDESSQKDADVIVFIPNIDLFCNQTFSKYKDECFMEINSFIESVIFTMDHKNHTVESMSMNGLRYIYQENDYIVENDGERFITSESDVMKNFYNVLLQ